MDAGQDSFGAAWDVVAPMIKARQREAAARNAAGLTEAEQETVAAMQARDAGVRAHEQAHARVGGQ